MKGLVSWPLDVLTFGIVCLLFRVVEHLKKSFHVLVCAIHPGQIMHQRSQCLGLKKRVPVVDLIVVGVVQFSMMGHGDSSPSCWWLGGRFIFFSVASKVCPAAQPDA